MKIAQLLQEKFLTPLGISQTKLAQEIGLTKTTINQILKGKRSITADTDLRLCKYFNLENGYFLRLQITNETNETKAEIAKDLSRIIPLEQTVNKATNCKPLKVGVVCGGPSLERGISLNSARSVMDHLRCDNIQINPIYMDKAGDFYKMSCNQLYSNTPSDFDFKLQSMANKIEDIQQAFQELDIIFPVIHGNFGEDGKLQKMLELRNTPFVGSDSKACYSMFHKYRASELLRANNFNTIPSLLLKKSQHKQNAQKIDTFFAKHKPSRVIVKPTAGGSSIGVQNAYNAGDALIKLNKIFDDGIDDEALIELFCKGREFTIIIIESTSGKPVALVPTEIQMNYENHQIFDYRRKYLPTNNTMYHTPPRFDDTQITLIQKQSEEIFKLFGMRDFVRLDGWLLDDGQIAFTDLNPISGMEQNSFLFRQAARIGITHQEILLIVLCSACKRYNIDMPTIKSRDTEAKKKPVYVLFGGSTAERQVSLMSGTNIWLKLRQSTIYTPTPFLLDKNNNIWQLPYDYTIDHTVEEIYENCMISGVSAQRIDLMTKKIRNALGYFHTNYTPSCNIPKCMTFEKFTEMAQQSKAFVFLALHGGAGEDGSIQQLLDCAGLLYNGSKANGAQLCMDKYLTGHAISRMGESHIKTCQRKIITISQFQHFDDTQYQFFWQQTTQELNSQSFIIKPKKDGCSAGIVKINTWQDLKKYIYFVNSRTQYIPEQSFQDQNSIIELSHLDNGNDYMLEEFIQTDTISINGNKLKYETQTGWIELTVGVLESNNIYHSLNPSITLSAGTILSLEEKFQGGTGINITPPPKHIISHKSRNHIKYSIQKIAKALSIKNYARIDLFFNTTTQEIIIIEANALPALTPSTVIYHQALVENLEPTEFLEKIIITAN